MIKDHTKGQDHRPIKVCGRKARNAQKGVAKVQVIPLHCVAWEDQEEVIADLIKTD